MFEKLGEVREKLFVGIICFFLGLAIGAIWCDIPYVIFKREFSLEGLVNFVITLFVAACIPFYINRHIDDKRVEKDMIIDMSKNIINEIEAQKKEVKKYLTVGRISKNGADSLRFKVTELRRKASYIQEMSDNYIKNKQIKVLLNTIDLDVRKYWKNVTEKLGDKKPKIERMNYLRAENAIDNCVTSLYRLNKCVNNF